MTQTPTRPPAPLTSGWPEPLAALALAAWRARCDQLDDQDREQERQKTRRSEALAALYAEVGREIGPGSRDYVNLRPEEFSLTEPHHYVELNLPGSCAVYVGYALVIGPKALHWKRFVSSHDGERFGVNRPAGVYQSFGDLGEALYAAALRGQAEEAPDF